jgi:putative DNA primase/helicase
MNAGLPAWVEQVFETFEDEAEAKQDKTNSGGVGGAAGARVRILPSPSQPMDVARVFVAEACTHSTGALMLRSWRGIWWRWRASHWQELQDRAIRGLLYMFTERAMCHNADGNIVPWAPTRRKIGDLLEALAAICFLDDSTDQPAWLDGRVSGVIVAINNGLLDVAQRRLLAHTPEFFNLTAVPFDYEPDAPEPRRWLDFLAELWPTEAAAIDVLGEWFGYVISGRLDLHKILLMVGPTRGGKGAIARILGALIGRQNVAGPTLHSLGGEFGLAPLLGKSLAVISDARFVGKNAGVVVERLLSISGEDFLTVNIKYKEQWTGKLPCRLHVISNELPKLGDASTAIVGRFVLLPTSRSWLGKEDYSLEPALHTELPGILNWALDGLQRLTTDNENRFTRLPSAEEAVIAMRDLASPVGAFVREQCEVGANKEIEIGALYDAFKSWCEASEYPKSSKHVFGRDLRAAVPSIRVAQSGGVAHRVRVYQGIALRQGGLL